jgi:putative effector of murein hydrolase
MENENGTSHVLHAIILTAVLYAIMVYVFNQKNNVAIDRSILIGTVMLVYMILFGHKFPPSKLNPNIILF